MKEERKDKEDGKFVEESERKGVCGGGDGGQDKKKRLANKARYKIPKEERNETLVYKHD